MACGDDDSDDPGTPTPTPTSNILFIFITWTNQKTFDISSGTVESKNPTADHVYVKYGDDAKTNMVLRRPIGNGRAGYSEEGPFTKVNN